MITIGITFLMKSNLGSYHRVVVGALFPFRIFRPSWCGLAERVFPRYGDFSVIFDWGIQ